MQLLKAQQQHSRKQHDKLGANRQRSQGSRKAKLSDDPLLLKRPAPAQLVTRKMTKAKAKSTGPKATTKPVS